MTDRELQIAHLISTRIKNKDPLADVILFGSHARGQANEESDWDILILIEAQKKTRKIEDKYRNEMFDLELELGEPISTIIYSKLDWETRHIYSSLYQNIKRDGVKI